MISFDEAGECLDELVKKLPKEVFQELNGGIILVPEEKIHPEAVADDLYILGEYHKGMPMGKYINIYYGSFQKVYGKLSKKELVMELDHTLKHELFHHLEGLAGEKQLEIKDKIDLLQYEKTHGKKNKGHKRNEEE